MQTHTLNDGPEPLQVTVRAGKPHSPAVLFAVGAGGDPERHVTLLDKLAETGCTVIAPKFQKLASPVPTEDELTARARRLRLALDAFAQANASVVGVGHSIGAAILLALAGGQMWLRCGQRVNIAANARLTRLALLAPPTGFFQAPGTLETVRIPLLAWVGSADRITPPAQTEWLAQAMRSWLAVDIRITHGAGHFSFMDQPPPQVVEPLQDKQAFLHEYSSEICRFVHG